MNAAVHQDAVDDLLEYCRNDQRVLNTGRQLAQLLLGRGWNGERDDYALGMAIAELLAAELARWRQQLAPASSHATATGVHAQLRADLAVNHPRLERLSLLHAYYIDGLASEELATAAATSRRSVQLKIKQGRVDIATILARRTVAAPQPVEPTHQQGNGQVPHSASDGAPPPPAPGSPHEAIAPVAATTPTDPSPSRARFSTRQRTEQHISGSHVQVVMGPVAGSVHQYQTHHTHHHAPSSERTIDAGGDTTLFWAGLLAAAGVGYWLLHTVPWVSVGALVLLSGWRIARHGWYIRHLAAERADAEERWWYGGHMLAWVSIVAWSIFMLSRLPGVAATAEFSIERMLLVVVFVGISMISFWLSTVDMLVWIDATRPTWWPARSLWRHAVWCWQQRWPVLGLTWLMLGIFSAAMVLSMLGLT